jgi:hypothetical protein
MPKGYPTRFKQYTSKTAAMGKRKTSVLERKGSDLYPKCVMYQYHEKAAAYSVLLKMRAMRDWPKTMGSIKNWATSVYGYFFLACVSSTYSGSEKKKVAS